MKCIRSAKQKENGSYEYVRTDNETAETRVSSKQWIYIPKEEYKRQSKHYKVMPNKGTEVNVMDADGNKSKKIVNPPAYHSPKKVNSTKIGKGSQNNRNIIRDNKYGKENMDLKTLMQLPLKEFQAENDNFDKLSQHEINEILKVRKALRIKDFKRTIQ